MSKQLEKKEKGITIIALVITIIVLIILAGISINTLISDNGIITKAKQTKENIQIVQIEEQEDLNQLYEQLGSYNIGSTPDVGEIGELTNKLQELQNKFDNIQAEYADFKATIANAITEKGVETLETDTANIMAENIKKLDGDFYTVLESLGTDTVSVKPSEEYLLITSQSQYAGYGFLYRKIDLSNISTIKVNVVKRNYTSTYGGGGLKIYKDIPSNDVYASIKSISFVANQEYSLDISDLSGVYYVAITVTGVTGEYVAIDRWEFV